MKDRDVRAQDNQQMLAIVGSIFFVQRRELWQGDARGDGEKTLFITF